LAMVAREAGLPPPGGIHVVSPFCDLTLEAETTDVSAGDDPWLEWRLLAWMAAAYIQTSDPRDWQVSPIYGDLTGLPPIVIHYAAGEAVADNAVELADRARAAGVDTTLHRVEDSVHSFVLFPFLPETKTALRQTAELVLNARREAANGLVDRG
jgi:salicylate hydroxylase